jgi:septum formation protein
MTKLYLASKSPRRKYLLQQLGVEFEVIETSIDETPMPGEAPEEYVRRIAVEKAKAGKQLAPADASVLAADTEVILDGRILGKPAGLDTAVSMLRSLAGRDHEVYTVVVLLRPDTKVVFNKNRVWFRDMSREECEDYCRTCRPLDKAGAYGIQDKGAGFIRRLEGSFSGVMGLPLTETRRLLGEG